jgi:hypothetical protein
MIEGTGAEDRRARRCLQHCAPTLGPGGATFQWGKSAWTSDRYPARIPDPGVSCWGNQKTF